MNLTNFGKFIRNYRMDHRILLKQMADRLGISSAFLSSVETGSKQIPQDLESKLVEAYYFTNEEKYSLYTAIDTSRTQSTISVAQKPLDQMLMGAFCRNLDALDDKKKQELLELLKGVK
jgi:transcriptional regulator with XRE-family HTH domain